MRVLGCECSSGCLQRDAISNMKTRPKLSVHTCSRLSKYRVVKSTDRHTLELAHENKGGFKQPESVAMGFLGDGIC